MGTGARPEGTDAATPARHATRARRRAVVLALAAAALLALALAANASAVIVKLRHHHFVSYQPLRHQEGASTFDAFFSNLDYNGGPVMPSNTNYAIYWSPSGTGAYPAGYVEGVDNYFKNLAADSGGHQNVDSVATQYNDTAGAFANYESHYGGELDDTQKYPTSGNCTAAAICLTDAQLQAELKRYIAEKELPSNLESEYFILLPPGVATCLEGTSCSAGSKTPAYCAYHSNVPVTGGQIIYSVDGFVGSGEAELECTDGNYPNGVADSALQGGLSHEHNESITDPEPNSAWTDLGGSGGEDGDKCRTFTAGEFGTPLGEVEREGKKYKYNQEVGGQKYWYQQEWSNQTNQCLQRFTFSGEEPTATFTYSDPSGTVVKLDASGSTAPGGVSHYNWQWNDGPGLVHPTETTSPTISHTFPAKGPYTVALTVFSSNGTSIGTSKTVIAGAVLPGVTKLVPNKGPASGGTNVTITGKNFTGASAVNFGGTPAQSFTVVSATTIEAVSPAGASGTANVTVTNAAGTSPIVLADHYKYVPTITALSPNEGPKAGGTLVTVTGSGFALGAGETLFKFGAATASGVCTSSTTCTLTTPAHAVGLIDVLVRVNSVTSTKAPPGDQFKYL